MTEFDTCIIGGGLAGTALAWALRWSGQRVAIIDRADENSASQIGAGLITPITGQRFVKSRRFDEFWLTAKDFYRRVETETRRTLFCETPMVRLFASQSERAAFDRKSTDSFGESLRNTMPVVDDGKFDATHGGFEMTGGRLAVANYLTASREVFSREQGFVAANLDLAADLELKNRAVDIPKLGLRSRRVIFCQGFAGAGNPWFRGVPFDAAKGEVLTVTIPGLNEARVFHRGIWLARMDNETYRVGATYDRENLNATPTPEGREELCSRLREFLRVPFEVVGHAAAMRPIITGRLPLLGMHPEFPQLGYFNGLASKGVLQSPWLAEHFAAVIEGKMELSTELDVTRRMDVR